MGILRMEDGFEKLSQISVIIDLEVMAKNALGTELIVPCRFTLSSHETPCNQAVELF